MGQPLMRMPEPCEIADTTEGRISVARRVEGFTRDGSLTGMRCGGVAAIALSETGEPRTAASEDAPPPAYGTRSANAASDVTIRRKTARIGHLGEARDSSPQLEEALHFAAADAVGYEKPVTRKYYSRTA
jgi:hypothetical protein